MAEAVLLPVETLRQLLSLDPDTGKMFWLPRAVDWFTDGQQSAEHKCNAWNARFADQEAFTADDGNGYRKGAVFAVQYRACRVAFALHYGRWPVGEVDHKDGDHGNDRPDNLREATIQQQRRNTGSRGGTSKYCGVSLDTSRGQWRASCVDPLGRNRHLGRFRDEDAAARAYDHAAREWHGEFARLNFSNTSSTGQGDNR